MNYISHPNLLVQFWAAVNQEFDMILDGFIRCDGWLFQDLGVIAKNANIGSIFRCAATTTYAGRKRDERLTHFIRVQYAILDAAKTQWLAPWRNRVVDLSKGTIPPGVKRQVGGFFLLYLLYTGQPLPDRFRRKQSILMDSRDLLAMHVFNATMQRLPKTSDQFKELARQLVVMFNELVTSRAFEFSAYSDEFITPSLSIQNLLAAKFCSFTRTIYELKDIRDQLYYITYKESPKTFQSLVEYGRLLSIKGENKSKPGATESGVGQGKEFRPFDKPWSVEEIKALEKEIDIGIIAHSIPSILKTLDFGPILTKKRLTGVSDKLLDREIDRCVKVYKGQTQYRLQEKVRHQKRICRERLLKGAFKKEAYFGLLMDYLTGNYKWVDEVFQGQNITDEQMKTEDTSPFSSGAVVKGYDGDSDSNVIELEEEDDEWETDEGDCEDEDEEVEDEVVFKKPLTIPSDYNFKSPKKAKSSALSMPTIL